MPRDQVTGADPAATGARRRAALVDLLAHPSEVFGGAAVRILFLAIVYLAAIPCLARPATDFWAAAMAADILWCNFLARRLGWSERAASINYYVSSWLLTVGYSLIAAAFSLQEGYPQIFGITLYGVIIFRSLAADHVEPRRLVFNVAPPVISILFTQYFAFQDLLESHNGLMFLTDLASPAIGVLMFIYLYNNLMARHRHNAEVAEQTERVAQEYREAHRIALLAEELVGVGHYRLEMATGRLSWSDSVYRIYGLEPGAPMPSFDEILAWYGEEGGPIVRDKLTRTMEQGESYGFELPIIAADGTHRIVASTGVAERNAAGEIATVFGVVMDVTEAREREVALAESEARYRLLADRATDLILRYDTEGVVEFVSPSVRQFGYEPEQLLGRRLSDFTHPDDRGAVRAVLEALKAGGELPGGEQNVTRARRADGAWVWLQGNPAPIRDDQGRIIGAVTVLRDITARRAMEEELRAKRTEAEAAAVAKAEFLANMSHEIRTPLTGIIGFAGLLERLEGLPPRAQTYVERITTSGQALLAVVNDVLDFSKMEAGQITLDPQPFDPWSFVGEALELVRAEARRKKLKLEREAVGPLPAWVMADRGRARQVLLNLLGNAVKFTHEGEVRVNVSHADERLRIEVIDTGVGIPAERLDRLFQRFSQVDGSISREFGGSGLGLAICRGLVEMMQGSIGVESEDRRGSRFWFEIAAPETEAGLAPPPKSQMPVSIDPLRILIADDVAMNRELVAAILSPFDVELTEAAGGAEAVEAALNSRFDLILMDLQMPGMDGMAATGAIRANSQVNQLTPILALSANVLPEQIEACREAGMNDHIAKPIRPSDLLAKIAQWGLVRGEPQPGGD